MLITLITLFVDIVRITFQICTNSENACGEEQFIVNSSDSGIKITLCYTVVDVGLLNDPMTYIL